MWVNKIRSHGGPICTRPVSSLISKKTQEKINEQKIKENRRLKKVYPEDDKDMPVYTYVSTNKNPVSRVFSWGTACYGALGNPQLLHPQRKGQEPKTAMHHPMRISDFEMQKVKDVACGYGYSLFAVNDKNGHVYGCGINNQGQFGYHAEVPGKPFQILIKPVPLKLPIDTNDRVKRMEAGQAHSVILTKNGQVLTLGSNAYGQCGRPVINDEDYFNSKVIHSVKIPLDENDAIVDIECGINHSMFLSQNGKVYSCGWSADGQTGLNHYDNQETPELIKGEIEHEKIVKVACAADCVLALNDQGDVFGWGNSEYGQFSSVTQDQQVCSPVKLDLKEVGKVIDVASGGSICMVLNDQHDVWVWGFGILGQGPKVNFSTKPLLLPPTLFGRNEFNPDAITTSIYCGVHNNAAINSYDDLYTWGKCKGGCLGLGDYKDQFFPFRVNLGGPVTKVSLGIDHTLALCKPYI